MKVGIPREVKIHEYRVAATPAGVNEFTRAGHSVFVEHDAGLNSSFRDDDYVAAGAKIVQDADDVWSEGDLILKVKEPTADEYHRMRPGQVLFTYLHLAASRECTQALLDHAVTAVAYETVQRQDGTLPLLHPMSEVAGHLAALTGAHTLLRTQGGRGLLLGDVSGVRRAKVVVLGAGVAGSNAIATAVGLGADVVVLDTNLEKLRALDRRYYGRLTTIAANTFEVERALLDADLVIGAVLVPGSRAPKLVTNNLVAQMRRGSVLVDISIDQGGCFADSRPTTHDAPTYTIHDVLFYCVTNMPGAVPHTSTYALTNATLPYALAIAGKGIDQAVADDPALASGVNTAAGELVCQPVAEAHGLEYKSLVNTIESRA